LDWRQHLIWYALAGVAGLIAGAYACLGVIILIEPSMGSEDTLPDIYTCAVAGAVLAAFLVRKWRARRVATLPR
jgi:hypothetical protein